MDFKEHVTKTIEYIETPKEIQTKFTQYSKIYPFATECITQYLKNSLPINSKNALTVLSSSDQVFNLLINGVEDITTFDINLLTYYFHELKKAYIIKNNYSTFINAINESYYSRKTFLETILNPLEEIAIYMNQDVYLFWKTLKEKNIDFKELQYPNHTFYQVKIDNEYIENDDKYTKLQSILKNGFPFTFYNCSIMELDKILIENFDYMIFSNIYDYIRTFIPEKECQKIYYQYIKEKIVPYLTEKGNIMFSYRYNLMDEFIEEKLKKIPISGKVASAYILKKD